jgi:hypothetical protein
MEKRRSVYMGAVVTPEGRRPLWRPKSRREDNTKMDLKYGRA